MIASRQRIEFASLSKHSPPVLYIASTYLPSPPTHPTLVDVAGCTSRHLQTNPTPLPHGADALSCLNIHRHDSSRLERIHLHFLLRASPRDNPPLLSLFCSFSFYTLLTCSALEQPLFTAPTSPQQSRHSCLATKTHDPTPIAPSTRSSRLREVAHDSYLRLLARASMLRWTRLTTCSST